MSEVKAGCPKLGQGVRSWGTPSKNDSAYLRHRHGADPDHGPAEDDQGKLNKDENI